MQKIFFVLIGAFPYIYLFLTVGGSFDLKFGFIKDHPWATAILVVGGGADLPPGADDAAPDREVVGPGEGGRPDPQPPEGLSLARRAPVVHRLDGEPLRDRRLPGRLRHLVTFHTLMRIVAGNSIANVTSVTPGGVGVNQAFNVASLSGVTSSTNATAYSVAQQLIVTA